MPVRKLKEDRYRIAMGPMAHRIVGARPLGRRWIVLRQRKKNPALLGIKGACPLMLPPPLGERGGHPRNFHTISKKRGGDFLVGGSGIE